MLRMSLTVMAIVQSPFGSSLTVNIIRAHCAKSSFSATQTHRSAPIAEQAHGKAILARFSQFFFHAQTPISARGNQIARFHACVCPRTFHVVELHQALAHQSLRLFATQTVAGGQNRVQPQRIHRFAQIFAFRLRRGKIAFLAANVQLRAARAIPIDQQIGRDLFQHKHARPILAKQNVAQHLALNA